MFIYNIIKKTLEASGLQRALFSNSGEKGAISRSTDFRCDLPIAALAKYY